MKKTATFLQCLCTSFIFMNLMFSVGFCLNMNSTFFKVEYYYKIRIYSEETCNTLCV